MHNKFINSVIQQIPICIDKLKDNEIKLYNFCLEGDLHTNFSLSSSVFVSKILYMLNISDHNTQEVLNKHILSFYDTKYKLIYDLQIKKRSFLRRFSKSIYYRNLRYYNYYPSAIAETRQSLSALICNNYNKKLLINYDYDYKKIITKIKKLDWTRPWHACSQLSHIIFFLHYYKKDLKKIKDILNYVEKHYRLNCGSWGAHDNISIQQKINGSMKMMTIFMLNKDLRNFAKKNNLIDLCLSSINNKHACDNFNIICCLYNCSINNNYRIEEIKDFAKDRIKIYQDYYNDIIGGFSFYLNKSQDYYYDARITNGKNTPDLQGTTLFLWGLVMISKILNEEFNNKLNLPIT